MNANGFARRITRDKFLGLIFLTALIITVQAIANYILVRRYQGEIMKAGSYDATFDFTRGEVEILQLRDLIAEHKGPDILSSPAIQTQLGVLKTRLKTLPSEIGSKPFPLAKATIDKLDTTLAQFTQSAVELSEAETKAWWETFNRHAREHGRIAMLANVLQGDVIEERRQSLARLMSYVSMFTFGLAALGVALTVVLLLQKRRLARQALTDDLTGLANRAALKAMIPAVEKAQEVAFAAIDIDRFKEINDLNGHAAGDEVLRSLSALLTSAIGKKDYALRLGGDEFAILASGASAQSRLVGLCHMIERQFRQHCAYHPETERSSLSIGIAASSSVKAHDIEAVMSNADVALYEAKRTGRGKVVVASDTLLRQSGDRKCLLRDLGSAIDGGQMFLVYQPIVDLSTGRVQSFESLLRWDHPDLGPVSPDVFIPLAEEEGEILRIGRFVLEQAIAETARWPEAISVSVNVSAMQLYDPLLVETVRGLLQQYGIDPARLTLEITESVLVRGDHSQEIVKAFQAMGVAISLDDFGTGYASMSYLRDHTFDKIKIDKSFVSALASPCNAQAIVRAICSLGTDIGSDIVAEGIETDEHLALAISAGCTHGQGYLFAKPMRQADVETFLATAQFNLAMRDPNCPTQSRGKGARGSRVAHAA
ncbi:bifunctional diguanylate cyclase/phosphodiesterase [Fulvimarina sp. MAC3]|uniref:putative bifunctional diguanylate cyclase/phosphodiesterase n=1 Tax=Fulvimarina sp. MAC3 TaxID=3148887 RepID=UPI0031FC393C